MPSRESRLVIGLLALAVAGHGLRLVGSPEAAPGDLGLDVRWQDTAALARQRQRSESAGKPLQPGETVDLNTASPEEIERLPRIGMSLAKRIYEERQKQGPFRDLRDLDRIPGIGPGLLSAIKDQIRLSGVGSPGNGASFRMLGGYAAADGAAERPLVDLNTATEGDLVSLPGIGRARAQAILAYRREAGSFAAVSELERVPGISRSLAARLAPYVTVH